MHNTSRSAQKFMFANPCSNGSGGGDHFTNSILLGIAWNVQICTENASGYFIQFLSIVLVNWPSTHPEGGLGVGKCKFSVQIWTFYAVPNKTKLLNPMKGGGLENTSFLCRSRHFMQFLAKTRKPVGFELSSLYTCTIQCMHNNLFQQVEEL